MIFNSSIRSKSDVFIAEYGTTTYAEIKAAYDAGKVCFCKKGTDIKQLIKISGSLALFSGVLNTSTLTLWRVNYNNTWQEAVIEGYTPKSHASTHATGGTDPITPASIGAAAISTTTEATLAAASWSGNSAPYTYTLTVNGVTDTSTQEILFATSINLEQLTAGQNANIQDGGQSANTIVLKAWGEKPTVDLPIRVIMRG